MDSCGFCRLIRCGLRRFLGCLCCCFCRRRHLGGLCCFLLCGFRRCLGFLCRLFRRFGCVLCCLGVCLGRLCCRSGRLCVLLGGLGICRSSGRFFVGGLGLLGGFLRGRARRRGFALRRFGRRLGCFRLLFSSGGCLLCCGRFFFGLRRLFLGGLGGGLCGFCGRLLVFLMCF